jgi:hypothetical protein
MDLFRAKSYVVTCHDHVILSNYSSALLVDPH